MDRRQQEDRLTDLGGVLGEMAAQRLDQIARAQERHPARRVAGAGRLDEEVGVLEDQLRGLGGSLLAQDDQQAVPGVLLQVARLQPRARRFDDRSVELGQGVLGGLVQVGVLLGEKIDDLVHRADRSQLPERLEGHPLREERAAAGGDGQASFLDGPPRLRARRCAGVARGFDRPADRLRQVVHHEGGLLLEEGEQSVRIARQAAHLELVIAVPRHLDHRGDQEADDPLPQVRPEPFHGPDHLGLGPVHRDLDDAIDQVVTGRAPQRPRALLDGAGQRRGTILEVAGLQRRGDRGDGRLVQCRPQLAVVGRFDRLEGAREVDAAAEVRAEAPAAVVDLEMVHQGAERLARIAASGPLPLQRPDPRLQKSPVPARPGDLQRRRQDRRRAEPVRALLQERLQLVARRGVAAVG
ncbi:MAG: hypothetical protein DMF51_01820, partial [Acidobacteria bacterium]